jgi:hypothetical protein
MRRLLEGLRYGFELFDALVSQLGPHPARFPGRTLNIWNGESSRKREERQMPTTTTNGIVNEAAAIRLVLAFYNITDRLGSPVASPGAGGWGVSYPVISGLGN